MGGERARFEVGMSRIEIVLKNKCQLCGRAFLGFFEAVGNG